MAQGEREHNILLKDISGEATLTYNVHRDTVRIISTRLTGSLKIGMAKGKKKNHRKQNPIAEQKSSNWFKRSFASLWSMICEWNIFNQKVLKEN